MRKIRERTRSRTGDLLVTIAFAIGAVVLLGTPAVLAESTASPGDAASIVRLAAEDEPGTPLRLVGIVQGAGGEPVIGARLYMYQTDAAGYYSVDGLDDDNPRLSGYVRTDQDGRFELISVRPGGYANSRATQHIHYMIEKPGGRQLHGEILFADDPNLRRDVRQRGGGDSVVVAFPRLDRDGVAHCDVILRFPGG